MNLIAWLRCGALVFGILVSDAFASSTEVDPAGPSGRPGVRECGSVRERAGTMNDYRAYHTDRHLTWSVGDIKRNHLDPAVERMKQGEFSHRVLADLDFMLRGWPNHHPALEAVIKYEMGGGRSYEMLTTSCYLARAREFAPDDVRVLFLEAYYFWQRGDMTAARDVFEEALAISPESIDIHYNLGLIHFELGDYAKSRYHARIAYAGGYPLKGLRQKLQGANQWDEQDGSVPSGPQP